MNSQRAYLQLWSNHGGPATNLSAHCLTATGAYTSLDACMHIPSHNSTILETSWPPYVVVEESYSCWSRRRKINTLYSTSFIVICSGIWATKWKMLSADMQRLLSYMWYIWPLYLMTSPNQESITIQDFHWNCRSHVGVCNLEIQFFEVNQDLIGIY